LHLNESILDWCILVLFTCKNVSANTYLVYCSDEDERTYIVVKSDEQLIDAVKSGRLAPHDVLLNALIKLCIF
jgi:hypothetical protein